MKIFKFARIALIITVLLLLFGCKKDSNSSCKTIKIGVLLGFTGTGSQNALETKAALDIGMIDVNSYIKDHDLGINIEIYFEDTQSDTSVAKIKAQSLIDKGVLVIIGPYTSAEAKAVKTLANTQNVLLISHSAVSISLAIPNDNFLRFAPCDTYQAEAITAMFTSDSIRAIIPVVRNDLWSNSLITATLSAFTAQGGICISPQYFEPGTTDFSAIVSAVKSAITTGAGLYGADKIAVYLISYGDGTDFLSGLATAGTNPVKIYGASAYAQSSSLPANTAAAQYALNNKLQCPVFGFDESAATIYEPIQNKIIGKIGSKASIYALAAYDILWTSVFAASALQDEPDFSTYKQQFISIAANYFGATGNTELDSNGDRKNVLYDFWTIKKTNTVYNWQISAKYNTTNHSLVKF